MGYANRTLKRIKRVDPQDGLEDDIKMLSLIEHELSTYGYERESDQLKAMDLRIKAVTNRARIHSDMLDRTVPRARSVEISTAKNKPFQIEFDFAAPEGIDVKIP